MLRHLALIAVAVAMLGLTSVGVAQGLPAPVGQAAGTVGKVNATDPKARTVNLSHGPIVALGWPAMTMDFGVAAGVDLGAVRVGDMVSFTVARQPNGAYLIDSLRRSR